MGSGTRNGTAGAIGVPSGAVERTGGRTALRIGGTVLATAFLVGLTPAVADAAPRRPSDSQIAQAKSQADAVAQRMDELNQQMSAAQAEVDAARAQAALALDEYQATQEASEEARLHAEEAAAAAVRAEADLAAARDAVVAFARRSYMQGSTYPGAAALLTSGSPGELVEKAALLEAAGSHRTEVLGVVTVAQVAAEQADATAQMALAEADALEAEAAFTLDVARTAEISAREQEAALETERGEVEAELRTAQQQLSTLVGERAAADRAAAARAAAAPARD
ncbi:hypothetical protein E4P43_02600, partial [Blastococcus sp. TF02A-35]